MEPSEVIAQLQAALGNKRRGRSWVNGLIRNLAPDDLRQAIRTGYDPWQALANEYRLYDPDVYPWAVMVLRVNWGEIEKYLTSAPRLLKLLSRKKENAEILKTPEGRRYLNRTCEHTYKTLYGYLWPEAGT